MVTGNGEVQAPATNTAGTTTKEKGAAFKNNGKAIRDRELSNPDLKAREGSMRDKVAFVCCLGDPKKAQPRVQDGEQRDSYTVVGYKFNLSEPMMVPVAPLKPDFKSLIDVQGIQEVQAPAGEIALNIVETGAFISKLEFAGQFTGGDKPVSLSMKIAQNRAEPAPNLRLTDSKGSIKQGMDLIAVVDANGDAQIKEEYAEKFAVLYNKKRASRKGSGAAAKKGETCKDIAAAFRDLYASKMA